MLRSVGERLSNRIGSVVLQTIHHRRSIYQSNNHDSFDASVRNDRSSSNSSRNFATGEPIERNKVVTLLNDIKEGVLPSRPSLTATDVTDYGEASFVADPFLYITPRGNPHVFFEVLNADRSPTAVIGHATGARNGRSWSYDRIVLDPGEHVSFPYVFDFDNTIYMIPSIENTPKRTAAVRLYEAVEFPHEWRKVDDLISPAQQLVDSVVFRWNDCWWLIAGGGNNDSLYAYSAVSLTGEWQPHEQNPVVSGRQRAGRPGGRPIVSERSIFLPLQDCETEYGNRLSIFEVTELTQGEFEDQSIHNPLFQPKGRFGWNSGRMHHLDLWETERGWHGFVDGDVNFGRNRLTGPQWSITSFDLRS